MNPSCTDLILTNSPSYFQNSNVFETAVFNYHKMVVTALKTSYRMLEPTIINYRQYKYFFKFWKAVINEVSKITINKNNEEFKAFFNLPRSFRQIRSQEAEIY